MRPISRRGTVLKALGAGTAVGLLTGVAALTLALQEPRRGNPAAASPCCCGWLCALLHADVESVLGEARGGIQSPLASGSGGELKKQRFPEACPMQHVGPEVLPVPTRLPALPRGPS